MRKPAAENAVADEAAGMVVADRRMSFALPGLVLAGVDDNVGQGVLSAREFLFGHAAGEEVAAGAAVGVGGHRRLARKNVSVDDIG